MIPTKQKFHAWLKRQRASRKFNYVDNYNCLIASWLKETKVEGKLPLTVVVTTRMAFVNGCHFEFPGWLTKLDLLIVALNDEFTVKELRAALKA